MLLEGLLRPNPLGTRSYLNLNFPSIFYNSLASLIVWLRVFSQQGKGLSLSDIGIVVILRVKNELLGIYNFDGEEVLGLLVLELLGLLVLLLSDF